MLGFHASGDVGFGEIIDCIFWEKGQHFVDVFVVDHAEDYVELVGGEGGEFFHGVFQSAGVVGTVAEDGGVVADFLPSAHEFG